MSSKKKKSELEEIEVDGLEERLKSRQLDDADFDNILKILRLVTTLRTLLQKRSFGLLSVVRKLFGIKTEKEPSKGPKGPSSSSGRGTGRRGRDGYPGADKIEVKHPTLQIKNICPECGKGKLQETEPCVHYSWSGQAPLKLDIYLLQRLVCPICKSYFTAPAPTEAMEHSVDDSSGEMKTGIVDRNAMANAMVSLLRFEFGVPHHRLAKIQERKGMGLPVANQDKMIQQVAYALAPIYDELINLAANGDLLHSDDTRMKILRSLQAGEDPPLKKTQTTVIISRVDMRSITLYVTGGAQAGANVSAILAKRDEGLAKPTHMSDGLAANKVSLPVEDARCLDHARRKFWEIKDSFKEECSHVLSELGRVYSNDQKTREMTQGDRLVFHQEYSLPVMDELKAWMLRKIESKEVEPNGPLGKAMEYSLKRWEELTVFTRVAGAPLSNAAAERAIKSAITHRKNSLFYLNANGAKRGDIIQSVLKTCEQSAINSFDYFAAVQENRSRVYAEPTKWMPWNYHENF